MRKKSHVRVTSVAGKPLNVATSGVKNNTLQITKRDHGFASGKLVHLSPALQATERPKEPIVNTTDEPATFSIEREEFLVVSRGQFRDPSTLRVADVAIKTCRGVEQV